MNEADKKKLVIPFIMFMSMLGVNVNSIINGVDKHQPWRIVLAVASSLIFIVMLWLAAKSTKRAGKQSS